MPQPQIFAVMDAFRRSLLKRERASATRLVNAYGQTYQRLLPQIEALQRDIEASVSPKAWKRYKLARLKTLRKQIEYEVGNYAVFAEQEINIGARQAIEMAGKEARILTQAALPGVKPLDAQIMQSWNRLPTESVETLLGFMAEKSPLRQSMAHLGVGVADKVEKHLIEGIALGYNPRKVAAIIREDLGEGLAWSLRTARTTQLNAYREAQRANFIANDHVVKGWTWRCARGDLTCLSCIAMDGTKHSLEERLNDHWNGRCFKEPETKTYRELGIDADDPPSPVTEDAKSWFGKQPEATQRKMMGNAKFDAWKAGKFDLNDLTKTSTDRVWGDMRVGTPLKDLVIGESGGAVGSQFGRER